MPNLTSHDLDVSRLLFDLKRCGELVSRFTGWLEPDAIATCVTNGLIEQFGCAFTRIWLVEPDRRTLRLLASAGLYTRLDGDFARVPMGAFKVGKIAQHCIPFLSNCLPDEDWVKDREWAIAKEIQGFAGLPLMTDGQAIGVLALFSHRPMAPEFLEVLQILSLSVAGALASAVNHQALLQTPDTAHLSEQMAAFLGGHKLSLLGTEQPLALPVTQLLLQMAHHLAKLSCQYCRLVYDTDTVVLEAMLATDPTQPLQADTLTEIFQDVLVPGQALGGELHIQTWVDVAQVRLQLPQQVDQPSSRSSKIASPLSEREQEVMQLLAQGHRDRDIAEQLYISERTVKFHAKNMLDKLGVRTRIQAVFEATKQGWLN
ncbi:LuxR C-terminal-related transcriptional regulator [Leptothoe sp. PORK10 BA2]|uniref:LuxR C-terminal-related transcriptional regulator n=1 Tax=Leptothoe sp. PORK10 BA2 TaxID=3110254 RepID=UPI002B201D41|nr:LuxR C-terminal-related transcriptional regulator [Leptothoe sp. PORK10 BA2]MEA5466230.1 LuxR C-terminal-related transcriptional regulator [Leptothoe sp. PORK10 BA2]